MNTSGHSSPDAFSVSELETLRNRTVAEISATAENRLAVEEEMVEAFMVQLLSDRDRFQKIFKTVKGSTYFVVETGSSLRFRAQSQGRSRIQPVAHHQILIARPQLGRLGDAYSEGNTGLVGVELMKSPYEVGSIPFEFDPITGNRKAPYEETSERLLLLNGVSRHHFGHEIVEIIK